MGKIRKTIATPRGLMTLREAAEISGVPYNTLKMRVYQNCPVDKLFRPSLRPGSKGNPTLRGLPSRRTRQEMGGIIIGMESSYTERWADRKAQKKGATRAP